MRVTTSTPPLLPTARHSRDLVDDAFGPGGWISRRKANYAPREGQIILSRAIATAIEGKGRILAEGPCGTGKSYAYAVPAIASAFRSGQKAMIVTAGIALQEQLVNHDLPFLQKALPWEFTFALAKGRSNYLCRERAEHPRTQRELARLTGEDRASAEKVANWARTTQTGDRSELDHNPSARVWAMFSSDDRCTYRDMCFYEQARAKAFDADVQVVNYHLYFQHIELLRRTGKEVLLPHASVLIMDEAHEAADIARAVFGFELTALTFHRIAKDAEDHADRATTEELVRSADELFAAVGAYAKKNPHGFRFRVPHVVSSARLERAAAVLDNALAGARNRDADRLSSRLKGAITRVSDFVSLVNPDGFIYFAETAEHDERTKLVCRQLDVGPTLRRSVYARHDSVAIVSATLKTCGDFSFIRRELGLDKIPAAEVEVRSPFPDGCLLVVPVYEMPDPKDHPEAFAEEAARKIASIIEMVGGRTLALHTSRSAMQKSFERVSALLGRRYRMFLQDDPSGPPKAKLVDAFRDDVSSCLFGTKSMFTGVDVPGESLSCVVIDKIPYPRRDDPVIEALRERSDRQGFKLHVLPRAEMQLRQAAGRVIRSTTDRGVLVLLDPRTTNSARGLLDRMPSFSVQGSMQDIARFLGKGGAA